MPECKVTACCVTGLIARPQHEHHDTMLARYQTQRGCRTRTQTARCVHLSVCSAGDTCLPANKSPVVSDPDVHYGAHKSILQLFTHKIAG